MNAPRPSNSTPGPGGQQYWLSYGGGVNSTALAILLVRGKLPQYEPFRILFADTGNEQPHTYAFIAEHFQPWLASHGRTLEIVHPKETVLARWERIKVTGSRIIRSCTDEAKIKPIGAYIEAGGGVQLIGIDAGEAHRMPDRIRPLVDLDIDREQCEEIISAEGLPSPGKSGCWHCPFARVEQIIHLAKTEPCKFHEIEMLEIAATETHGENPKGGPRTQWKDKPARYWRQRASQGDIFKDEGRLPDEPHCGCGT